MVNAVLIQNVDPKPELQQVSIIAWEKLVKYLAGDPLSYKTLQRASAHKAKACILLTNKNSSNSSEEDYKNILIALAIKKEVYVAN